MTHKQAKKKDLTKHSNIRFYLLIFMFFILFAVILGRLFFIQIISPDKLIHESDIRSVRVKTAKSQRGAILDRHKRELAVSVPMQALWIDPKYATTNGILKEQRKWQALAEVLHLDIAELKKRVNKSKDKRFLYIARQLSPSMANYIKELDLPSTYLRSESRRFYPTGEVLAQLIGLTNIDDVGIEGLEGTFDEILTASDGKREIRKTGRGLAVESLGIIKKASQAKNLELTIDYQIQAIAYQELKSATDFYGAAAGVAIVVDVETSEILALANTPSFNPNNRRKISAHRLRNRAITDVFEPGSVIKPISVLAALETNTTKYSDIIDTYPGWIRIGGSRVQDLSNYGSLAFSDLLQKSSNVGITKIALKIPQEIFLEKIYSFGLGRTTGIGLIGESPGLVNINKQLSDFERATLSFGYGMAITPIQLAQIYTILGAKGNFSALKLVKGMPEQKTKQIAKKENVEHVLEMLTKVTQKGGTGTRAQVAGYKIAGKTGTTRKAVVGGYGDDYIVSFAGVAPAKNPKLALVVVIDNPAGDSYYGGLVAAPVFSKIMAKSLRVLNIAPDDINFTNQTNLVQN